MFKSCSSHICLDAAPPRYAGTEADGMRTPDGRMNDKWHWNMPYSVKRDLPEWFTKELERYSN
jgi:hypothetical protein